MNSQSLKREFRKSLVLFIIILTGLSPAGLMHAKDMTSPSTQEEMARMNLEPFARAYKEIAHIYGSYEKGISQSDEQGQLGALQQEIHKKTTQAIASQGLTVEDYNTISSAIQNSPALKEEFITIFYRIP
jgi:hypothetical protein